MLLRTWTMCLGLLALCGVDDRAAPTRARVADLIRRDTLPRTGHGGTDTTARADTIRIETDSVDDGDPGLAEFRARAHAGGTGHFLDERTIDDMHLRLASDALRRVPGIVLRQATGIGNLVRIRGCAPLVWVHGQRVPGAELDDVVRGPDVAAMEVFSSTAGVPARYADRSATCGTILVWLRSR